VKDKKKIFNEKGGMIERFIDAVDLDAKYESPVRNLFMRIHPSKVFGCTEAEQTIIQSFVEKNPRFSEMLTQFFSTFGAKGAVEIFARIVENAPNKQMGMPRADVQAILDLAMTPKEQEEDMARRESWDEQKAEAMKDVGDYKRAQEIKFALEAKGYRLLVTFKGTRGSHHYANETTGIIVWPKGQLNHPIAEKFGKVNAEHPEEYSSSFSLDELEELSRSLPHINLEQEGLIEK
jgi:hypothetical protein